MATESSANDESKGWRDGSNRRRKEVKLGDYVLCGYRGKRSTVKMGWKKGDTVQVAIKLIRRKSLPLQSVTKSLRHFPSKIGVLFLSAHLATMPPRTPLGPKNADARVQKKTKTSGIELSPHKHSVIKGLHKASCSAKSISEIENIPHSTVCDTIKFLGAQLKGQSLPCFEHPSTLTGVEKHSIIHFCCENVKTTYFEVKQKLQLSCSLITIHHIVRKQGIKKWLTKKDQS
jgi:hypothetical protein